MRAWTTLAAALLVALPLAGCLAPEAPPRAVTPPDVGYDPTSVRVDGVRTENLTFVSYDGTQLSALAHVPVSSDVTPLGPPRWPLAVFLHGWGGSKESYQAGGPPIEGMPAQGADRLMQFARAGMVVLAYDARGFGASGGQATVAGPAEQRDLDHLIAFAQRTYPTNGRVGVVGASYGGGQALLALVRNPEVGAAVSMYGWADLAAGLIPGDVPKLAWGQFLYGYGLAGSAGRYDPMIHNWYRQAVLRERFDLLHAQMAQRSSLEGLPATHKPLLLCQGMQETLFPQADLIAARAGGFVRTYVFTGGHGADDEGCWARALAWLQFFLGGFDTRVDSWPALETVDASGSGRVAAYAAWPAVEERTYRLRGGELSDGPPSGDTFTVEQRLAANPLQEPSALWDPSGMPSQPVPQGLRQDPAALFFTGPAVAGEPVLLGAPALRLHVVGGDVPFQVAGTLYRLTPDGSSLLLSRAAAAVLDEGGLEGNATTLGFSWVHAQLGPGDRLQLKLAANEPGAWYPLLAAYAATFDGRSELTLPMLAQG